MVLNHLQTLLENADTPELLMSVINVILQLTKIYPHVFSDYFRVGGKDILVVNDKNDFVPHLCKGSRKCRCFYSGVQE